MTHPAILILFGVIVGVFSGVMGLGGGSVMIPVMVFAFGMTQQQAHGTSAVTDSSSIRALPALRAQARTQDNRCPTHASLDADALDLVPPRARAPPPGVGPPARAASR